MRTLRSLEEQAAYLERRRREKGIPAAAFVAARNSGRRRTPEKRALLRLIRERTRIASGRATASPPVPADD